jgi:broad specificity phosphatase PhoE
MGSRRTGARVLLVRHGESTWNVEGRWQGRADPPLSPEGERQARDTAAAVDGVSAIWSSDLARARRTAELLAAAGVAVRLDARLRERDVGSWAGLTTAEIDERYPGWIAAGRRPPGWERDDALRARCWPALRAIEASLATEDDGVVVTHGGLIRVVAAALGASPWPIPNLSGVWLESAEDTFVLGQRVSLRDTGEPLLDAVAQPD